MRRAVGHTAVVLALRCQGVPGGTVSFKNVSVLPMDRERVLDGLTVGVSEGRIARMGPSIELNAPRGFLVVDGQGRFLLPGFIEMHGHSPRPDTPPEEDDPILSLFLSNGVTTVRGMLGHPFHLELRQQIESGVRLGPTLLAAGPALRGTPDLTVEEARNRVRPAQDH